MSTMPEGDILVVDDLSIRAMNRPAELAEPDLGALGDDGDVLDPHRRAVLRRDDRILDVAHVCGPTRPRAR